MPILLLNPKFIDKINYLKNQLFWYHAKLEHAKSAALERSFSDPQEKTASRCVNAVFLCLHGQCVRGGCDALTSRCCACCNDFRALSSLAC